MFQNILDFYTVYYSYFLNYCEQIGILDWKWIPMFVANLFATVNHEHRQSTVEE